MSLRLNIATNFISQFYVAFVGIFLIPVYLRLMGAEGYGLVAFFTLLQSWFQLLDLGLTATMSRETARFLGGGHDALSLRGLMRSLEGVFWSLGLVSALALIWAAPVIASQWLHVESLPREIVVRSVSLIALTIALRWISGLYRGAIAGLERQVWLGLFNMAIVTARFVVAIPVLIVFDGQPIAFFLFQAVVSCIELAVLMGYCYSLVPLPKGVGVRWSLEPLRSVFRFSATVAFTSVVGVFVTQSDKLIISKMLPLKEYGLFTAAVLVASGIILISGPVTLALLPRLTKLSQEADEQGVVLLYRRAAQAVTAVAGSSALALAVMAKQVLWVWTGDAEFALGYFPVLALYAAGNGFFALAAFPYYLQYAKGDLQLHFWGNVVFVLVLTPAIVMATVHAGAIGAGTAWAVTNAVFFFCWTPLVHRRFLPGLHTTWLLQDVAKVIAVPLALSPMLWLLQQWPTGRLVGAVVIVAAACSMIGLALYRCELLRPQFGQMLGRLNALRR